MPGTFKEAFRKARKAGKKTFTWYGKDYNTKLAEEAGPKPRPKGETRPAPRPAGRKAHMEVQDRQLSQDVRTVLERTKPKKKGPASIADSPGGRAVRAVGARLDKGRQNLEAAGRDVRRVVGRALPKRRDYTRPNPNKR